MSLLTIVQSVARRVKVPPPSTVVGSTDPTVLQLWELLNEEGDDLASSFDWQTLIGENVFSALAQTVQPGAVPTDLDHYIPNTFWNRSNGQPVIGPVTAQDWQALQARPLFSMTLAVFQERQGDYLIYPTPNDGDTIAFNYVSKNWATSADGTTPQSAFMQDGDLALLDEKLMGLGLRWRFKSANGLDYAEDFRSYEENKAQSQARDGGSRALQIAGQRLQSTLNIAGAIGSAGATVTGPGVFDFERPDMSGLLPFA